MSHIANVGRKDLVRKLYFVFFVKTIENKIYLTVLDFPYILFM